MNLARQLWAGGCIGMALLSGCAESTQVDGQSQDEEGASLAGAHRYDAKDIPDCDGQMRFSSIVLKPDFGASFARANWLLDRESVPEVLRTPLERSFVWKGVTASNELLRCDLTDCSAGGSRVRLGGSWGDTILHVHWEPEELAWIAEGTRLTMDANTESGQLVVTSEEGELLFAVVRYSAADGRGARGYTLGGFQLELGAPVCTASESMCNYRSTAVEVDVSAGTERVSIAPAQRAELSLDGKRYEVINHITLVHGAARQDQRICGAGRGSQDALSVMLTR